MLNWVQPDLILTRSIMELNRYFRSEVDYAFELMKGYRKYRDSASKSKSDVMLETEISFDVDIDRSIPLSPRTLLKI